MPPVPLGLGKGHLVRFARLRDWRAEVSTISNSGPEPGQGFEKGSDRWAQETQSAGDGTSSSHLPDV